MVSPFGTRWLGAPGMTVAINASSGSFKAAVTDSISSGSFSSSSTSQENGRGTGWNLQAGFDWSLSPKFSAALDLSAGDARTEHRTTSGSGGSVSTSGLEARPFAAVQASAVVRGACAGQASACPGLYGSLGWRGQTFREFSETSFSSGGVVSHSGTSHSRLLSGADLGVGALIPLKFAPLKFGGSSPALLDVSYHRFWYQTWERDTGGGARLSIAPRGSEVRLGLRFAFSGGVR